MTNVKPEHMSNAAFLAMLLVRPTDGNGNVPESRAVEVIAALIQERDTARADARVLAEELDRARGCVFPDPIYGWDEPRHLSDYQPEWKEYGAARAATDASGALERNRSKE